MHENTRICNEHFVNAAGRQLRIDDVPSRNLPGPSIMQKTQPQRKPPKEHFFIDKTSVPDDHLAIIPSTCNVSTQSDLDVKKLEENLSLLRQSNDALLLDLQGLEKQLITERFRLANMKGDDSKIAFHTGFPSYGALKAFYDFLGPAVDQLNYSSNNSEDSQKQKCRPRILPPLEEFFLTIVRLRLGLMEQDLAYRFDISQPTVCRIISTWVNFIYLKLKEIPLWPPKDLLRANMPKQFKEYYPSTRVIIDATEIYIQQPDLPELQQMTYSSYKNDNTFKGIVGISPDGVVTFVSSLFPGCISDKELTRRSGILDLLEAGDSVMADRGFDISEDLILIGVDLNIPPFMRGKQMYHIFDRALPAT